MTTFNDELLRLDLQFFADKGDDEGDPEGSAGKNDKDAEPTDKEEPKVVTMTQEELDALIGREKGRVKGKYADYDELKTKLSEFETQQAEAERAKLSEIERLQADLQAKKDAEKALAEQLDALRKQTEQAAITNAFNAQLQTAGVKYPDAAVKLADLSAVQYEDGGKVSGVEEVVAKLVEDHPFLVTQQPTQPIGEPANNGKGAADEKTKDQRLEEARQKAVGSGLPKDFAEYAKLKRDLGL